MQALRRRAAVATAVAAGLVTTGGTLVAVTAQAATSGCSVAMPSVRSGRVDSAPA
jgi:uncharacterized protein YraI